MIAAIGDIADRIPKREHGGWMRAKSDVDGADTWLLMYGLFADRLGHRNPVRLMLLVQVCVLVCFDASSSPIAVGLLTIVIGSFPPGIVPLVLAQVRETIPDDVY
ncbi:MAG TPA: hypothetical protein VNE82_03075 [Candidatus Binataceae bacterium]|nr:hypothetical protein [Candidatus Binataceae bacterium]